MPIIKQEIIDEIKSHIQRHGGEYSAWHVGVCTNIRDKLSGQTKAKEGLLISRQAYSSYVAAEVLDYFVNKLGTDGSIGADNDTADIIYAYRKSADAIEQTFPANDTSGRIIR